jgi:hypothetical protein
VQDPSANFRRGSVYSIATAVLLAAQEPFSALAAKRLSPFYFICITQTALLFSVPLLTTRMGSRRDFFAMFSSQQHLRRLAILFVVGLSGLLLYNLGLRNAHPIIISAILNLSPFWAALVAKIVSGKSIPVSLGLFSGCFFVAFMGAMLIAFSQLSDTSVTPFRDLWSSFIHGSWKYAIPIPLFFALSGTLVGQWFGNVEETAAIAANFVVSASVLIPGTLLAAQLWSIPPTGGDFRAAVRTMGLSRCSFCSFQVFRPSSAFPCHGGSAHCVSTPLHTSYRAGACGGISVCVFSTRLAHGILDVTLSRAVPNAKRHPLARAALTHGPRRDRRDRRRASNMSLREMPASSLCVAARLRLAGLHGIRQQA